ncbi:gamma-glutamylcyclotransferase family protein [Rariglobus hedericola]|uniref:Gamma-glutamylcyclotransferase n=1 Tax=Rariglobus hedericola TaxID=2597822 RepID=A0A556QLG7_9BACT|nr:gamma-glutamylcyclotransferase family protein [Rariglobus hedericola]TSJ77490.1 gamma-glutamylcyclotransferase [Rariglobus hedericola]
MPEPTGHMLHFAYGEDLPHAEFERVCPGAQWFGPAGLEGYQLVFNAAGRANVKAVEGATVWGALWMVPASSLPMLDAAMAEGYERCTRRIVSPAGPRIEAMLYLSTASTEAAPAAGLLDVLLGAAKENRLPAAYVNELKALGMTVKSRKDSR